MQLQQKDTACGARSNFPEGKFVLVLGDVSENTTQSARCQLYLRTI